MKRYLTLVLLLALCLTACTPKAPAPTETAPPPEAGSVRSEMPAPVWGEQVFQRDYAGEESNADAPEGVVVSLRFVMPYIENAGAQAASSAARARAARPEKRRSFIKKSSLASPIIP